MPAKTITISGSHGDFVIDADTGIPVVPNSEFVCTCEAGQVGYASIVIVDVDELRAFYAKHGEELPDSEDVLYIGYFFIKPNGTLGYEEPEAGHRWNYTFCKEMERLGYDAHEDTALGCADAARLERDPAELARELAEDVKGAGKPPMTPEQRKFVRELDGFMQQRWHIGLDRLMADAHVTYDLIFDAAKEGETPKSYGNRIANDVDLLDFS